MGMKGDDCDGGATPAPRQRMKWQRTADDFPQKMLAGNRFGQKTSTSIAGVKGVDGGGATVR